MEIAGLQKLTLLDYPGHIAATIFTKGCNFRCPFCHNKDLVLENEEYEISEEEVFRFLKSRVGILDGVAITGGEPLLQKDITEFIKKIRELGFKIKLDTNGSFPNKLEEILKENLVDYVAMDIKNAPSLWSKTTGLEESVSKILFDNTKKSMDIIRNSNVEFEFRTTIVEELHDLEKMDELAKFIYPCENYFLQNFVDSGNILVDGFHAKSEEELNEILEIVKKTIPNAKLRGVD